MFSALRAYALSRSQVLGAIILVLSAVTPLGTNLVSDSVISITVRTLEH